MTTRPAVPFEDPRVQVVYNLLCADETPPPDQHWEGWVARRIVDALAAIGRPHSERMAELEADPQRAAGLAEARERLGFPPRAVQDAGDWTPHVEGGTCSCVKCMQMATIKDSSMVDVADDAAMLDWLERKLFGSAWGGTIGRPKDWRVRGDYRHTTYHMVGNTFREAIRAAMKTTTP